jgi:ribosomal protein S18 acetylase RimI-like enzyme
LAYQLLVIDQSVVNPPNFAPMEIRDALPSEHAALGELCVRAYRALGSVSDRYAAALRDVAGRARSARVLVAADGGALLGCVTLILADGPLREISSPHEGEFRMLAVDPAAQGRGVGEALVRACVDEVRHAGRTRVVISSAGDMLAAHRLYERLGFTRAPARDWWPIPDVQLRVYELAL